MTPLEPLFITIFSYLYTIIYNEGISFLILFLLVAWAAFKGWKLIRRFSGPQPIPFNFVKWGLIALEVFILLFLVWYLLDLTPSFLDNLANNANNTKK